MRTIPKIKLHHRLWIALEEADIDVETMAGHLGVHRNTISNYIHGRSKPPASTVKEWARITGADLAWLAGDAYPKLVIDLTDSDLPGDGIHSSLGMVYQPSLPFSADDPAAGDLIGAGMGLEAHYAEVDLRDERVSAGPLVHAAA